MKIVRLHVEKGRSTQIGDNEWRKIAYGLEADVSDVSADELEKLRLDLSFKIDDWLQQEQGGIPPESVSAPRGPNSGIPQIDLAELDECPWQTFQKKPAKAGTAAWIKNPTYWERFDAPPVLWELVKALDQVREAKREPLILGDMEYVFGGKDDMKDRFINRKTAKMERAT